MQKTRLVTYLVAALMISTAVIYFIAASEESADAEEDNSDEGSALATQVQTGFFTLAGIAYTPVGLWMLKKNQSRVPYIIAIFGSLSLIGIYAASRTINLPIVGLQEDIGSLDIASKVIQGIIITGCVYVLGHSRR